jgi:hypothetical protein
MKVSYRISSGNKANKVFVSWQSGIGSKGNIKQIINDHQVVPVSRIVG